MKMMEPVIKLKMSLNAEQMEELDFLVKNKDIVVMELQE
jgi:hypothetical protein